MPAMAVSVTKPWWRGVLALLLLALAGCEVVSAPSPNATPPTSAPPLASSAAGPTSSEPFAPRAGLLLSEALALRAIGDDDGLGERLSLLLATYPAALEARPARYYLAESFARRQRWTSAAELFRSVAEPSPPGDLLAGQAIFWLARCAEAAGDAGGAASFYERYVALGTLLAPYALIRQAAQQQAGGQQEAAAASYERGAQAPIVAGERVGSYAKAIALRRELGQPEQAFALYEPLLALLEQPSDRAKFLTEASDLARSLGRTDQARTWLLAVVEQAPASQQAAAAVEALLAAGDPGLSAEAAGRVYFNLERYAEAAPLLATAVGQAGDPAQANALRRLHGLALRAIGDYPAALNELAAAGAADPNNISGREAQLDWVQTLGQSGETAQAAAAYRQFAEAYPDDPQAPEALAREAILRDRLGDSAGANQARRDLGVRFPASQQAAELLHALGLAEFQAGRYAEAEAAWLLLSTSSNQYERSRGAFWAGRSATARGDSAAAGQHYQLAQAADFDSYYSARAADELGLTPPGSLALSAPLTQADYNTITAWIASWPGQSAAPPEVDPSPYALRAVALATIGLHDEALGEWNALRDLAAKEPYSLLAAAQIAQASAATYSALSFARQLLALAPPASPAPPIAFQRLRFPTPYPELVAAQAREHGVDPRLIYALMRQESLFDPLATSWVGARGLAQVMPETGQGIAQNLGVSDFALDDLYRPLVSIRFGAFYLGTRLKDMNGSPQGALAAYNGGLGNALRWANGPTVADPDLFAETIDFPETENYVKLAYGNYGAYRQIYSLEQ